MLNVVFHVVFAADLGRFSVVHGGGVENDLGLHGFRGFQELIEIALFLILSLLLRLILLKPFLSLFEAPGISAVNTFFGGVIGFVDAFLIVSLLAYLLKLLMPLISSEAGILNESTIYNSFIFYHFYSGNIFSALVSLIGL